MLEWSNDSDITVIFSAPCLHNYQDTLNEAILILFYSSFSSRCAESFAVVFKKMCDFNILIVSFNIFDLIGNLIWFI